ncbi:MAG: asparagine--tRNA ligase [Eubacteriales bacterium]|nr:asparagine--tRNA ligase [Eubacteriales bacterium]
MKTVLIQDIGQHNGKQVTLKGWLYNRRSSGKIQFLIIRDGTGFIQGVLVQSDVSSEDWELAAGITQESSVQVTGTVKEDSRSPLGFELQVEKIEVITCAQDYPISLKEHGVDFLLDHRHLWLRTPRQASIMHIRNTVVKAMRDWLDAQGFTLVDAPILTPAACEGTTTLFETEYFGDKAYLSQSGQLYMEAAALALGRVYCFGPTFRAEKSKTRRHLIEFWMMEPEMAFVDHNGNMALQEEMVKYVVRAVLDKHRRDLALLERDTAKLENVINKPFAKMTYDEAIEYLQKQGHEIQWGDDFGAPDETVLANLHDGPVFVEHFPTAIKAFYMKPVPGRPEVVLAADLLAPEGYGEIIGGSQRIDDLDLLLQRIQEHKLPEEAFKWYLDLRRYGSVPHSGFGIGLERFVSWICGLSHLREAIPFPRLINRLYP